MEATDRFKATSSRVEGAIKQAEFEVTTSIIAHLGNAEGSACCYCSSGSSVINSDRSTFNKPQAAAVSMDAPQIARIINYYDFCPVSRSSDISNGSVVNAAYQLAKPLS